MEFHTKYYLLEFGLILEKAEEFRKEFVNKRNEIFEYVAGIGGKGYKMSSDDCLYAIQFPKGQVPAGFKKPDKYGCHSPYKKSEYANEFQKYKLPKCMDSFQGYINCPTQLSYSKSGEFKGIQLIGHPFKPIGIYWYSGDSPLLLTLPDVKVYVEAILKNNPGIAFDNDADKWAMDEPGVKEILKEEWDLMVAIHKRKSEQ